MNPKFKETAYSVFRVTRGTIFEYGLTSGLLMLDFEFNPSSITRTRTVSTKMGGLPGMRGGYDFQTPSEALRAVQGISVQPETLNFKILIDATDRMNAGDKIASAVGIQPELDVLRSMMEPKSQQPPGAAVLSALGANNEKSFPQYQALSVLIFKWGVHILPVFMTRAQIETKQFLPTLIPYRAEVSLDLQVIESENPFYITEAIRRSASMAANALFNVVPNSFPRL
ncbi:MAG: hypothetical protein FWH56_06130 [Betaproteobacteria bacterium]|nr:hypothetical protein [Betaproteobacteria bacterium]